MLALARSVDRLLVVGAAYSSNSNRLREIGEAAGVASLLVSGPDELDLDWLDGCSVLGVTAGASAPEFLVQGVLSRPGRSFNVDVETMSGVVETTAFKLPPELLQEDAVVEVQAGGPRKSSPTAPRDL